MYTRIHMHIHKHIYVHAHTQMESQKGKKEGNEYRSGSTWSCRGEGPTTPVAMNTLHPGIQVSNHHLSWEKPRLHRGKVRKLLREQRILRGRGGQRHRTQCAGLASSVRSSHSKVLGQGLSRESAFPGWMEPWG